MSTELHVAIEGKGKIEIVPKQFRSKNGNGYGFDISYAIEPLDILASQLKVNPISQYLFDPFPLYEQAEELEIENDQKFVYSNGVWYHPYDAIASLQKLNDSLKNQPNYFKNYIADGVRGDSSLTTRLNGVLWDLRMVIAIIEDANNSNKRFRLEIS